jgi:hypothetical protein
MPVRPVFRDEAVRRYIESKQAGVLPVFVSPPVFAFVWVIVGILLSGGLFAWAVKVPQYTPAQAIVITTESENQATAFVCLVNPATSRNLYAGLKAFVRLGPGDQVAVSEIESIEPAVASPQSLLSRYPTASAGALRQLSHAAAVVWLGPPSLPRGIMLEELTGGVYPVQIETGSRRAVSLIPLLGRFFD